MNFRRGLLRLWIAACPALVTASWPTMAQNIQNGPTDTDLRAAYCMGVDISRAADWRSLCEGSALAECQTEQAKISSDHARLYSYLFARGYFLPQSYQPLLLIAVPESRGETDYWDCLRAVKEVASSALPCQSRCTSFDQKCREVAWAGGSTARQYAALPDRHGGLCRGRMGHDAGPYG
jgi:hypothetical protein